ncbi:hypothetical protein [Clostridium thermobutyricum]|uniref:Uncharacterized protein n=1 Tax=Clostridium thermobutyricum DSM 4928 TaxID=1121339 RepID=A0A1V4SV05_9CLOT|nr:hypothetical protein [Clostridium thermobutyricum]OPX47833.1 hypothetical protein CLTHE_14040 [Clostridium thermobutyricum DSM 4928]
MEKLEMEIDLLKTEVYELKKIVKGNFKDIRDLNERLSISENKYKDLVYECR